MEFLLRRLMLLAGELRDALAAGDAEEVVGLHVEYDEAFATFRHLVDSGHPIAPQLANDVQRLARVHDENVQLTRALADQTARELGSVRSISTRMSAYAPLGAGTPGVVSRFVDGSA